jgi:peptidoglycan L-alanyl-D-glutamate endopeptidase CwlK
MAFMFSAKSIHNLAGVHPSLYAVMQRAITMTPVDFMITEGLRTKERQEQLVKAGASKTMNSRHLAHPEDGLSRAADFLCYVNGRLRWDWPLYAKAAEHIKRRAEELGIQIVWGGDWKKLRDGPHIELSRQTYP